LLVDDELDILSTLKRSLEMRGYSVTVFNEPERALADFKPNFYDLIILDVRMPGINGFDLARSMWKTDPASHICFMTAFEIYDSEANKVFRDFNTKCFVKKPVTTKVLIEHIESHLARTND
jgi:DNA-binding response OmpR family regulator